MADVWRDIECDPFTDIEAVSARLQDVFGLEPYRTLHQVDLRHCDAFKPTPAFSEFRENTLPLEWKTTPVPHQSQLLNADCLEALATLPENSVDFCFADPPYNLLKKYDHWNDGLEVQTYFAGCDRWLSELCRVLKPGGTLAVLNLPLLASRHFQHLEKLMEFQNWIVWEALGFPVRMIMPAHYAILCFSKGKPRNPPGLINPGTEEKPWLQPLAEGYCLRAACVKQRSRRESWDRAEITDLWSDIHRLKHNSRRVDHPCQLPPALMQRLYALFTNPGETILDPFNGAGTSTLTAQLMGRLFIGIERSPAYHELALKRHQLLSEGGDPFGRKNEVPGAKNSPVQRLAKQKYEVSKRTLQLDVKRIAEELGRLPSRAEVAERSPYSMDYFDNYFTSWGEVCAAARTTGMSETPPQSPLCSAQPTLF